MMIPHYKLLSEIIFIQLFQSFLRDTNTESKYPEIQKYRKVVQEWLNLGLDPKCLCTNNSFPPSHILSDEKACILDAFDWFHHGHIGFSVYLFKALPESVFVGKLPCDVIPFFGENIFKIPRELPSPHTLKENPKFSREPTKMLHTPIAIQS